MSNLEFEPDPDEQPWEAPLAHLVLEIETPTVAAVRKGMADHGFAEEMATVPDSRIEATIRRLRPGRPKAWD